MGDRKNNQDLEKVRVEGGGGGGDSYVAIEKSGDGWSGGCL